MYINISLLEKYFKENGIEINTNVDIDSSQAVLKFVLGSDKDGSRVEFLNFKTMAEILIVNDVISESGMV